MEPGAAAATGIVLGLSSGGYCFWSCASVMAPFLVTTDSERLTSRWSTVGGAFRALGWYNLGRLLAYLGVGLGVSLLAGSVELPPWLRAVALLATAALLGHAVVRPARGGRCWRGRGRRSLGAFALGMLQGLSPCPPFLIAVGMALTSTGVASGLLLFLTLFAGTALYTLPLAFLEPLRRRAWLFAATRIVGAVVALYLVGRALDALGLLPA